LRESYARLARSKKRTLLNLSDWPHERIAGFKALLKGGTVIPKDQDAITIIRSLPHGHVDAALGTARKIGLDRVLGSDGNRCRDLILALAVSRILDPFQACRRPGAVARHCKLQPWRAARSRWSTRTSSIAHSTGWRSPAAIEAALAKRISPAVTLVLYDVSSSYLEGRCLSARQLATAATAAGAAIAKPVECAIELVLVDHPETELLAKAELAVSATAPGRGKLGTGSRMRLTARARMRSRQRLPSEPSTRSRPILRAVPSAAST